MSYFIYSFPYKMIQNTRTSTMKEIFKDIPGYEGLYQVSNLGRVKSLDRIDSYKNRKIKGKLIKPYKHTAGYYQVSLCNSGNRKHYFIHRLVYEAFNGKIQEDLVINHLDENKINNSLDNLEAITQKANVNYGTGIQRNRKKQINNNKKSKPVIAWNNNETLYFPSIGEAKRQLGFCAQAIGDCCRNCYSTVSKNYYKGYFWKYK